MIFYFTGTNNSLYVAKRILNEDERLINIAEAMKNNEYEYEAKDGEPVGFIFPVYFYTVPTIVSNFISGLKLNNCEYAYALITCGGGIATAGSVLKKQLNERGITLNYLHEVLMPDNSMLFYQIPPVEESEGRLNDADRLLEEIKKEIEERCETVIKNKTFVSDLVGVMYKHSMKTAKFNVDSTKCTGCGLCSRNCAESVIVMDEDKRIPKWTKNECCKCSACINRCPAHAINYGKSTAKRNRYVNPRV